MCRGMSYDRKMKYHLLKVEDYAYLTRGNCTKITHVHDSELMKDVLKAFDLLIPKEYHDGIWSILSAVLLMGNLKVRER